MKKLVIDRSLCIDCGTCAALCPKVFEMNDQGKVKVIDQNADTEENIKNAITSCPVMAIRWEE